MAVKRGRDLQQVIRVESANMSNIQHHLLLRRLVVPHRPGLMGLSVGGMTAKINCIILIRIQATRKKFVTL